MKQQNAELLVKLEGEIQRKFERWDDAIENGQQPVPIQDLDQWLVWVRKIKQEESK